MKLRKKIAKHRAVLGWGLGYLNLLLIPLIAAHVLQLHLYPYLRNRGYETQMPFVIIWLLLVLLSWFIGTIVIKFNLVGEQSRFETEQVMKAAARSIAESEEEE